MSTKLPLWAAFLDDDRSGNESIPLLFEITEYYETGTFSYFVYAYRDVLGEFHGETVMRFDTFATFDIASAHLMKLLRERIEDTQELLAKYRNEEEQVAAELIGKDGKKMIETNAEPPITVTRWVVELNGEYMQPLGRESFGPIETAILWMHDTDYPAIEEMAAPFAARVLPVTVTIALGAKG